MKQDMITEEMQKARGKYREKEKQELIDSFEKGGAERTRSCVAKSYENGAEYAYGVPVLENGKLQGFNMMVYGRFCDDRGHSHTSESAPWKEDGKQVFMTIDEYYKFSKEADEKDGRLGANVRQNQEDRAVRHKVLRESIDEETLNEIKEKVRENRIKQFRARYEKLEPHQAMPNSPFVTLPGDGPEDERAYGEAVMEKGKLIGFNMMRWNNPRLNRKRPPVLDENGKQLFMTVEEMFDLHESQHFDCIAHELIDDMIEEELEHRELNKTTLGRVRMKAAKAVEEATGVKLPKASLNFKKKLEKPASELIDRIRERRARK